MMASDILFGFVYVLSLVLHCSGYCVKWNLKKRENVTAAELKAYEVTLKKKKIFELVSIIC